MPCIVAMTKPNQEGIASENLRRQGCEPYCPRFRLIRPNKAPAIRVLFPRYILVLINQAWPSLTGTRGITSFIQGSDGPQYVPMSVVNELRRREDTDGLVRLAPVPRFEPGASVKTNDGLFVGQALIYEGMAPHERVRVLVNMMGRLVRAEVDEKYLVAA